MLDLHEALDAPVILESRERRSANERRWAAAGETIAKSRLVVRGTVVDARIALETASLQKRIVRPYAVTTVTMTGNWRSVGETAWRNHQWDHTAADSSALLQLRLDQDDIAKIQKRARDAMDDHEKQTVYKFVLLLLSCGRHKFPSVCYGAIQETCDCSCKQDQASCLASTQLGVSREAARAPTYTSEPFCEVPVPRRERLGPSRCQPLWPMAENYAWSVGGTVARLSAMHPTTRTHDPKLHCFSLYKLNDSEC